MSTNTHPFLRKPCWLLACASLSAFVGTTEIIRADVKLPVIISDHMVLEKSGATAVWGKADPGEEVTVALAGQTASAKAAADGKWRAVLDLSKAAAGPLQMTVRGKNEIQVEDVVIGDVWVASGQSNMQFELRGAQGAEEEIAAPANPLLRHFKVKVTSSLDPMEDCEGTWEIAGPKTLGEFTAVGYFFGKSLQKELGVPVGLINASLGGTAVESWTSPDGLRKEPELAGAAEAQWKSARDYPDLKREWLAGFQEWTKTTGRTDSRKGSVADYAAVDAPLEAWTPLKLPGKVPGAAAGARWYRKVVEVPGKSAGKSLFLILGEIEGFEEVYWNGELVGSLTPESFPGAPYARRYDAPANLVKEGPNILAIRVFSPDKPGGLTGRVFRAGPVALMGEWLTRAEYEFPAAEVPQPPVPPPGPRSPNGVAGSLFNGMISPILPYTIKGVIWYQGEGNASRAWQYRKAFPLLIQDWRSRWNQPDLPFYFCQLANNGQKKSEPVDDNWAELRDAQTSALKLPHTGQAILIDIGESEAIHPINKKDAGERLAKLALAGTYGKKIPFSGPILESSAVEGAKIRLRFAQADGGLVARPLPATYNVFLAENRTAPLVRNSPNSEIEGFAICGEDHKWVWADARIEGGDVLVWSDQVSKPVAVRYGWAENPTVNLYNGAGLPAVPFRTDDFKMISTRKYQP